MKKISQQEEISELFDIVFDLDRYPVVMPKIDVRDFVRWEKFQMENKFPLEEEPVYEYCEEVCVGGLIADTLSQLKGKSLANILTNISRLKIKFNGGGKGSLDYTSKKRSFLENSTLYVQIVILSALKQNANLLEAIVMPMGEILFTLVVPALTGVGLSAAVAKIPTTLLKIMPKMLGGIKNFFKILFSKDNPIKGIPINFFAPPIFLGPLLPLIFWKFMLTYLKRRVLVKIPFINRPLSIITEFVNMISGTAPSFENLNVVGGSVRMNEAKLGAYNFKTKIHPYQHIFDFKHMNNKKEIDKASEIEKITYDEYVVVPKENVMYKIGTDRRISTPEIRKIWTTGITDWKK